MDDFIISSTDYGVSIVINGGTISLPLEELQRLLDRGIGTAKYTTPYIANRNSTASIVVEDDERFFVLSFMSVRRTSRMWKLNDTKLSTLMEVVNVRQ